MFDTRGPKRKYGGCGDLGIWELSVIVAPREVGSVFSGTGYKVIGTNLS